MTTHPDVAEAAVLGVDDDGYGQRLAAFVVLTPAADPSKATGDRLKQHVRDNLANYKVPREIVVLDERRAAAPARSSLMTCWPV